VTREDYEEAVNAYEMAYQDYSAMLRRSNPDPDRVSAAEEELRELRALIQKYEEE
jgi:hypothetical protein